MYTIVQSKAFHSLPKTIINTTWAIPQHEPTNQVAEKGVVRLVVLQGPLPQCLIALSWAVNDNIIIGYNYKRGDDHAISHTMGA